jgi:hypothetical protein
MENLLRTLLVGTLLLGLGAPVAEGAGYEMEALFTRAEGPAMSFCRVSAGDDGPVYVYFGEVENDPTREWRGDYKRGCGSLPGGFDKARRKEVRLARIHPYMIVDFAPTTTMLEDGTVRLDGELAVRVFRRWDRWGKPTYTRTTEMKTLDLREGEVVELTDLDLPEPARTEFELDRVLLRVWAPVGAD